MSGSEGSPRSKFELLLILAIVSSWLQQIAAPLRYLKYLLPPFAALMTAGNEPPERKEAPRYREFFGGVLVISAGVMLVSIVWVLWDGALERRVFDEAYFILAPLVLAYLMFIDVDENKIDTYARAAFYGLLVSFLLEQRARLLAVALNPTSILGEFLTSQVETESTYAFVFGLFCLHFAFTGKRRLSIVSFVLVLLGFKRIAVAACLLGLVGYYLLRRTRMDVSTHTRLLPAIMVAINGVLLFVIYQFSQGAFDDLIEQYTGIDANLITMGRLTLYDAIIPPDGFSWLGSGLGYTTHVLSGTGLEVLNAHSDVLKYAIELGPPLSAYLIWSFYRYCCRSNELFLLMGYLNLVFVTDNVSIYFDVMFVFYVLVGFSVARARHVE